MKRIICLLLIIICPGCFKTKAQEIVFDPVAFDEMVMQSYAFARQIENQIKEIAYLYDFVQMQIKSIEKLDPDTYFTVRNYIIGRKNAIDSLKFRIRNLNLKISDERYYLGDVLPTDEEIAQWYKSLAAARENNNQEQYNSTLHMISEREQTIRQYLTETGREAVAIGIESQDFVTGSNQRLQELLDQIEGNESITSQLQISNQLSLEMNLAMLELIRSLSSLNSMYAANSLSGTFKDYKLSLPQIQNPGTAGMEGLSEDYYEYVKNKDEKVFDPIKMFE